MKKFDIIINKYSVMLNLFQHLTGDKPLKQVQGGSFFRTVCFFISAAALAAFPLTAQADEIIHTPANVKTYVSGFDFSKTYKTSSENLFYLLLSALNENNYSIEEIQFKTGSVLFKAYTKEFIASIASKGAADSFIKIIPADNNYNFSPLLIHKLHKYIETNNNINFQRIL